MPEILPQTLAWRKRTGNDMFDGVHFNFCKFRRVTWGIWGDG